MRRYAFTVRIRELFAIFVAMAVLFAPATSAGAAAMTSGHAQMLMMDHSAPCQMPVSGAADHHNKTDGKSCCASMCMAVAVAPSMPRQALPVRQQVAHFASFKSYHGLPAEIATPPPRFA
jgi:hypothetical protein